MKRSACSAAIGATVFLVSACGLASSTASRTVPLAAAGVKRSAFLTGVTCASTEDCIAVGRYYGSSAGPILSLAAHLDGHAWLGDATPNRGRDSGLDGVSCASATYCIAVGATAEAWNGNRWTAVRARGPMSTVSCVAPGVCQALGGRDDDRAVAAARWDLRGWHAERVPEPISAPQNITIAGVSCASARFCMAVGEYSRGARARPSAAFRERTLAELWNGSRWRLVRTPSPTHNSELGGVSCTSRSSCTAVGSTAAGEWALAERWNGRRWARQRVPSLDRVGYTALTAVSCAAPTACIAVGTYNLGEVGIAERWNGARWKIMRLPAPSSGAGQVVPAGIWCASPTACMTVGTTNNMTLAERWNGTGWTVEPTPDPG